MSVPMSNSGFQAAMSILSHVYFAPILGRLIRARVPDLLDGEAVHGRTGKPSGPSSTLHGQGAARADGVRSVPRGGAVHVRE